MDKDKRDELAKDMREAQIRAKDADYRELFPEDVAYEIHGCIAQVDYEFSTPFKQYTAVGNEIDIEAKSGQWFTVKITERKKPLSDDLADIMLPPGVKLGKKRG